MSIAAAAPAYAVGSQQPTLTFNPGNSYVAPNAAGGWDFFFDHAYVSTGGTSIQPNRLSMTVTFVPDSGHSANEVTTTGTRPQGWSNLLAVTVPSATYIYLQAAGTGIVSITDGHYFSTAQGAGQVGSFVLTFHMPNLQDAVFTLHAPPTHALEFNAGSSYARSLPGDLWGIQFQGASLTVRGGDIAVRQLIMEVTFVPDPGQTDASFSGNGTHPDDWLGGVPAVLTPDLPFFYNQPVSASTQDVTIPITDGWYFSTHVAAPQQTGSFQLRIYAPGFNQTIYRMHVPGPPQLRFDPGASYARHAPSNIGGDFDLWGIQFAGASVTVSGGSVAKPSDLKMTVTYVPDPGFTDNRFRWIGNSPLHWPTTPAQLNPLSKVIYSYDQTVDASTHDVAVAISDGEYFTTLRPADGQQGQFQVVFSAPGFAPATYRVHVPQRQLEFDPGTSFVDTVTAFNGTSWALRFRSAHVTVVGGDILSSEDLKLTASFVPDAGSAENQLGTISPNMADWEQPHGANPSTTLVYSYLPTVSATVKDVVVPVPDGSYFYAFQSTTQQNGSFKIALSAPGFATSTYQWHTP